MLTNSVRSNVGYLTHMGGSVCPEDSSSTWEVSGDNDQWLEDRNIVVECVQVKIIILRKLFQHLFTGH